MEGIFKQCSVDIKIIDGCGEQSTLFSFDQYSPIAIVSDDFGIKVFAHLANFHLHGNIEPVDAGIVTHAVVAGHDFKRIIVEPGGHFIDDHIIFLIEGQPLLDFQYKQIGWLAFVVLDIYTEIIQV